MKLIETMSASLRGLARDFFAQLPQILIALGVLILTWLAARWASRLLARLFGRTRMRRSLIELLQKLLATVIWVVGILIAATIAFPTLTPAKVLTALGLGSIAVGFAFKDIFENFLAGLLILFREPFRLQDYIESEGIEGFVEEITIRDTHLRQTDGQRVVIPNAQLFKNPVTVRTDRDRRRTTIICGIAYGDDVDQARDVMARALADLPTVDKDQPIEIFAQAFGGSSIDFEVTWWTGSKPLDLRRSRDEVVAAVKRALDDAGIEIPFPYRTLTFKEPLTVTQPAPDSARPAG
jgi:small-conductance mechanosensitive channel